MSRSSFSKGCTPAGSGRAGLKRRRSSVAKPGSGKTAVHACISGIRKLARRAGVMRIGKGIMDDPNDGALLALREFLDATIRAAVKLAELARRATVTPNDISYALKGRGITLYSLQGADWTYGFYNRERVRARITGTRLTHAQLTAAAVHFAGAASQAGSAAAQQEQGAQPEAPAAQQEPAVAAEPQQPQPQQSPAPSAAHSAAAAAAEGVPTPLAQRPAEQQVARQQAGAAAAAAAMPAADGFCADGEGEAPGSVAPAGERRLSGVPTPAVVSEARAAQIQRWLVEELLELQKMTDELGIRLYDLRRVMVGKHGCSAGEVQHVLYCLEQLDRIMVEEGVVYSCC